jgi:hypothetical protein
MRIPPFLSFPCTWALAAWLCACTADNGSGAGPAGGLRVDSIVVDLFTLNAVLGPRLDGDELTPQGEALMVKLDSSILLGEDVIIPTDKQVRTYSAHCLHEHDLRCDRGYQGDSAWIIRFDDSIPAKCHDTDLVEIPSYPFRNPVAVKYLEGKGFWLKAGQLDFARGQLKILFDYFP